jgi:hypothetical protein
MDKIMFDTRQLSATNSPRHDIYSGIHKAVRAFMFDTLSAVMRIDCNDAQEVAQVTMQVRDLVTFCEGHLAHENEFVHAAMEARRPGSSGTTGQDHVHHLEETARLAALAIAVEQASGAARTAAAADLRRYLSLFIADNLTHMNFEENENNAVLWEAYTDAELGAIEHAIVASLAPEEMAVCLRWMIPALSPAERTDLLAGMRENAPAPVFEGALAIARTYLSPRDWNKLAGALMLPDRLAA